MRRYTCGTVFVLVAALAASPGWGVTIPVITSIDYRNGLGGGMAENAGYAGAGYTGGNNPRHVTIHLGTLAADVTMVRFNGADVNGLAPVTNRFVSADKGVEADGTPNDYALTVEVPPMMWEIDTRLERNSWPALIEVAVIVMDDDGITPVQSNNCDFQYFEAPVVLSLATGSDPYISTTGTSITWYARNIPDASLVEVEFTGPAGTFTFTGTDLTVAGLQLTVKSLSIPTDTLGEYVVTVTTYPVGSTPPLDADLMFTSTYTEASQYNEAGDPIKVYVVHPAATITDVTDAGSLPIYFIPIAGNVPVIIEGTNFHNTSGSIPGTEVRFDDVLVTVNSYIDTEHMRVTVPPCADGTERAIKVGVENLGSSSAGGSEHLVYRDFPPTVAMLSPAGGGTLSGAVRLQADARDDAGLAEVEYWYAVGAGPHYHPVDRATDSYPSKQIYDDYMDGKWDPHADDRWNADDNPSTADWMLIDTVDATVNVWPYTHDWTPVADDAYTITAVAYDNHTSTVGINDNETQAQTANLPDTPVTITVDNVGGSDNPPEVTISSPTDGADIYAAGGNIFLRATATDLDSTVTDIQFSYLNKNGEVKALGVPTPVASFDGLSGTLLWDGEVSFPVEMTAQDGPLYIIAEATSDSGPVGYAGVAVNIVSDASTDVSISYITPDTSDYAGADAGNPITVTVYGSGFVDTVDQDLTVYFGGAEAGDLNIVSSTELTVTVPHIPDNTLLGPVAVLIEITDVTDPQNVVLVDSAERNDLFTVTDSDPQVTIASPAASAVVGDGIVIVADAIDDKGITEVVFDVNGTQIGVDTTYPYSVVWDMTIVNPDDLALYGNLHTITATAKDGVNTDATDSVIVIPSNSVFDNPPVVTITLPATETVSGSVAISFTVTDVTGEILSGIGLRIVDAGTGQEIAVLTPTETSVVDDGIEFKVWTYTTEESPTDERWDTTAGLDGSFYLIEATATDDGGNTGVGGVNVTVQNGIQGKIPPPPRTGGGGCHVGDGGGNSRTAAAWLLVVFLGAIPFLASRRVRRAARERAR